MDARQAAIEAAVARQVASLRSLTSAEADQALAQLKPTQPPTSLRAWSSWDDREEDTWIDRM